MKEINIRFYYKIFEQNGYISPLESETQFSIMRKSLLSVVFLMVSFVSSVNAQEEDMFEAPDTVCIKQSVQLISNVPDEKSHYWGFCSGYLYNEPLGANLGDGFGFDGPSDIEVSKADDGNYYGFVVNPGDNTFKRLNYGKDLGSVPEVTDFGDMDGIFPDAVNKMYLVRDPEDNHWYIFITYGQTPATSGLGRIDFGESLANTPNIVTFGNLENALDNPGGLFVSKQGAEWYCFITNSSLNNIIRYNIGDNISLTPTSYETLNIPGADLAVPTDIGPILDNDNWYFFITNGNGAGANPVFNSITRVDMGSDITNLNPTTANIKNDIPDLGYPSSIMFIRDCGRIHAFITNRASHDIVRMEMDNIEGPYDGTNFSKLGPGQTLSPTGISRIIRDRDNVYAFITNQADATLTRMLFEQCDDASISYSLTNQPPAYQYNTAGLYNVYYAVNEGMPDMRVQCKLIRALPIPALIILPPDTTICEGDTANLRMISINAISFDWTPNYNISSPDKSEIRVWPEVSTRYNVRMPFPLGNCIVDTFIDVNVIQLKADAGPDRSIKDGATTMLGGPYTTPDDYYLRRWSPNQYIDDIYAENPTVQPPHDFTYYLTITDTATGTQCVDIDTVVVRVNCGNVNLPNAFMPERGGPRGTFSLLNNKIVKLDHFNIYDRWGKQVFSTSDPTTGWDGTIGGEKAAVGVYVWEVDGFCESGQRLTETGNVMLVR